MKITILSWTIEITITERQSNKEALIVDKQAEYYGGGLLKIRRIKAARALYGLSLSDSKKWVENRFADYGSGDPLKHPIQGRNHDQVNHH